MAPLRHLHGGLHALFLGRGERGHDTFRIDHDVHARPYVERRRIQREAHIGNFAHRHAEERDRRPRGEAGLYKVAFS